MELFEQIKQAKIEVEGYTLEHSEEIREMYYERFLSPKGLIKDLFGKIKNIPAEERKNAGQTLNEFRQFAEEKYEPYKKIVIEKKNEVPNITKIIKSIVPGPRNRIDVIGKKERRDPIFNAGEIVWSMIGEKAVSGKISLIRTEETINDFTIIYDCYFSRLDLEIQVDGMPDKFRIERKEKKIFRTKEELLASL